MILFFCFECSILMIAFVPVIFPNEIFLVRCGYKMLYGFRMSFKLPIYCWTSARLKDDLIHESFLTMWKYWNSRELWRLIFCKIVCAVYVCCLPCPLRQSYLVQFSNIDCSGYAGNKGHYIVIIWVNRAVDS